MNSSVLFPEPPPAPDAPAKGKKEPRWLPTPQWVARSLVLLGHDPYDLDRMGARSAALLLCSAEAVRELDGLPTAVDDIELSPPPRPAVERLACAETIDAMLAELDRVPFRYVTDARLLEAMCGCLELIDRAELVRVFRGLARMFREAGRATG